MTGCSSGIEIFTITEPIVLTSITNSVNVICHGDATGQVSVIASGGTGPYIYLWEETSSPGVTVSISAITTGLGAGNYECIIIDASLCVETTTPVLLFWIASTLFCILNLMPCFFKIFINSEEISLSMPGVMWSKNSTTCTSAPNLDQTEPISNPI